jgi:hypothetical protein
MSNERLPAKPLKSDWGEAAKRAAQQGKSTQAARREATRRTVGVYERPPQRRGKLSFPLIVIMILALLISLVLSIRFLF